MTAEKLNNVKDGKLISLLKRLLKEIKSYVKQLLSQKEVEIDKLPDNMTISDLANLLAYSNSKLILPGYEVIYSIGDGLIFKTYSEINNHIKELARQAEKYENVDLTKVKIDPSDAILKKFLDSDKEYAQTREIIEIWKKTNNIVYNPEEAYSRGQEFIHIHNAYGNTDTITWLQNLIPNLEDVKKSDGVMEMSFLTYKQGKLPNHVMRNLNPKAVIKIIAYPKSKDIAFASKIDNYTSSYSREQEGLQYFIDLSKVKKREQLAVNYTKSIRLNSLNTIEPNIADTIDDVAHHNEYAINIADGNFRIEYGEEVPFQTKKIIDNINSILDQKYGKLIKPEIKTNNKEEIKVQITIPAIHPEDDTVVTTLDKTFNSVEEATKWIEEKEEEEFDPNFNDYFNNSYKVVKIKTGIPPTQTNKTLKESIESVKSRMPGKIEGEPDFTDMHITKEEYESNILSRTEEVNRSYWKQIPSFQEHAVEEGVSYRYFDKEGNPYFRDASTNIYKKRVEKQDKEFTSQALINTKIAKLKEVAKKYPRSLIRSEVVLSNRIARENRYQGFEEEDLPFQKIPTVEEEDQILESFVSEEEQEKVLTSDFVSKVSDKLLSSLGLSSSIINFVTAEEAIELTKDSPNPYNNQPAFYFKGNIYFVNGQMDFTTAVHEISHVFIKSIRYQNPELFNKLYSDIVAIPEMAAMIEEIKNEIGVTEVTGDVKEEAIVRFFTEVVKNDIIENVDALDSNFTGTKEKRKIVDRILFAIKKLLRQIFGKNITIEKLNKNTTLKELSELLLTEGFEVNMEVVSKDDVVSYITDKKAFQADIVRQLDGNFKSDDLAVIKTLYDTVNKSSTVYVNTLKEIQKNKDLEVLGRVFQEGYEEYMRVTGTKKATEQVNSEILNKIISDELDSTIEFSKTASDLTTIFATQDALINNINARANELKNQKVINDQKAYINEINAYVKHLKGLITFVNNLSIDAEKAGFDPTNAFIKEMKALSSQSEGVLNKLNNALLKVVAPVLTDHHNKIMALERAKKTKDLNELKEKLKDASEGAAKSINRRIKDIEDILKKLEITKEEMQAYIKGEKGDITYLETFMEEFVAQQDPSIATLAMYVKARFSDSHIQNQQDYTELRKKLQVLEEEAGLNPGNIEEYASEFLFTDVVDITNDEGELVPYEVFSLLNPYKNKYNTKPQMIKEINALKDLYDDEPTKENREKLKEARKKLSLHNSVFFHNEAVPEYYFIDNTLLTNPDVNGAELLQQVDELYSEIRTAKEESKLAQTPEEKADIYQKVKHHRFKLNELYSDYQNGKKKNAEGLKNAKALREHREAKRKFHTYVLNRGDFEDAYAGQQAIYKAIFEHQGLSGKKLEEALEKSMEQWINESTRVVIKQSFYERKAKLIKRLQEVSASIEAEIQKDKFIGQVINSTVVYNDLIYTLTYDEVNKNYILTRNDEEIILNNAARETKLADIGLKIPTKELYNPNREIIFGSLMGKKDDNNEYYASEITEEHMAKIKELEEEYELNKSSIVQLNGLTADENQELSDYFEKYKNGDKLSKKEFTRKQLLLSKKTTFSASTLLKKELKAVYAELAELQSKEPSGHYFDAISNFYDLFKEEGLLDPITQFDFNTADKILDVTVAQELMNKDPEYKEWFEKNHYLATVYDSESETYIKKYQRLAPWDKTIPTNPEDYESFKFTKPDGTEEQVSGLPNIDFYSRALKDEFKTGYDPVTKKVDNSEYKSPVTGLFRPRNLDEISALKESNPEYFTDLEHPWDHYVNYDYYKLKNEGGAKFEILETIRKYHYNNQKGLDAHDTLEDILPRYRSDLYENLTSKDRESLGERARQLGEKISSKFVVKADDFEEFLNYSNHLNTSQRTIYQTDEQKIPITGKYLLDKEQVSKDIFKVLGAYAVSAGENRALQETSTIARTLQSFSEQQPVSIVSKESSLSKRTKRFVIDRLTTKKEVRSGSENLRKTLINAMVETMYEGKQFVGGTTMGKVVKALKPFTALASHSFFAFDLHSSLKNYIGARSSVGLQALNSNYFSYKSFWLSYPRANKAMVDLSRQIYRNGVQSLDVQIINYFDGFQGRFKEKFGTSPGRTLTRDFVNMSWFTNTRQYLEVQTNIETLFAMLEHVKVEQKLPGQEPQTISYLNAWELDSDTGKIKLKEGIDSKYAPGGTEFNNIKFAAQEHNAFAQGVYSDFDKTLLERTPFGAMTTRMKKFFVKMALDRFAFTYDGNIFDPKERINLPTGKSYMGFHIRTVKTMARVLKSGGRDLMYLSRDEKIAFVRSLIDYFKAQILWKYIILQLLLGFDPDSDDDEMKYQGMRARSGALPTPITNEEYSDDFKFTGWVQNNLILTSMYAEDEIGKQL
jgi:hypothetical protein